MSSRTDSPTGAGGRRTRRGPPLRVKTCLIRTVDDARKSRNRRRPHEGQGQSRSHPGALVRHRRARGGDGASGRASASGHASALQRSSMRPSHDHGWGYRSTNRRAVAMSRPGCGASVPEEIDQHILTPLKDVIEDAPRARAPAPDERVVVHGGNGVGVGPSRPRGVPEVGERKRCARGRYPGRSQLTGSCPL